MTTLDTLNGLLTIPASNKGRAGAQKAGRGVTFPIGSELADRVARQLDQRHRPPVPHREVGTGFHAGDRQLLAAAGIGGVWREVGRIAWDKDQWTRKVREAVHAAGLDPEITLYSLRHARIIRLIQGGMALREIAALTDTSARS